MVAGRRRSPRAAQDCPVVCRWDPLRATALGRPVVAAGIVVDPDVLRRGGRRAAGAGGRRDFRWAHAVPPPPPGRTLFAADHHRAGRSHPVLGAGRPRGDGVGRGRGLRWRLWRGGAPCDGGAIGLGVGRGWRGGRVVDGPAHRRRAAHGVLDLVVLLQARPRRPHRGATHRVGVRLRPPANLRVGGCRGGGVGSGGRRGPGRVRGEGAAGRARAGRCGGDLCAHLGRPAHAR